MSATGKFFRAPPTGGTLFDSSEEESSSEEEVSNKRSRNQSDDEEDYEEYEENKKRKKNDKKPSKSFFDEEAEDAGSDDDESVYGEYDDPHDRVLKHYTAEDIARENLDDEAKAIMAQQDRRRMNSSLFNADMSADDVAEMIKQRHKMSRKVVDRRALEEMEGSEGGGTGSYSAVSQQSLVPSVSDPSMWMFHCVPGKETELVYQIMNKCIAYGRQGRPLGITAAIASQTKGRIYIESYSEPAVIEATQGVRKLLFHTRKLVPINDMTTVMSVVSKKKPVKTNDWVRLTRGHFKGDLALVKAVRDSGLKCVVQCVPRLDLTLSDLPPEEAKIRRKNIRPAQKFFNASEIAALGKDLYRQRFPGGGGEMCDYFEGNYYHDGYLLKEVAVGTMIRLCTKDDPPTLDELQRFRKKNKKTNEEDEEDNEGSKIASSLLDELSDLQGQTSGNTSGGFVIGDTIEVIEGDLIGMRGKLTNIDGSTVKIKPSNATDLDENTEVEFLASQVRKYIAVGAHVKVIDGRYVNETGVVVAVDGSESDFTAVVLTDMTHKEISVRISQLQESAEVASGLNKLAGYELHDLVTLGSSNEVGVITRVGREEFSVINNHGIVRDVRPEELRGKKNGMSNRAVALDVQGNQIRCGDLVTVAEGPNKGKTATIKRMSRAQLFLYSQLKTENAGIFVVRSRSCMLTGNSTEKKKNNITQRSVAGPKRNNKQSDSLQGKSIRIQSGQWKGYLGTVCDTTATHVQVELHSRLKKVMVTKERVIVVGDKHGANDTNTNQASSSTGMAIMGNTTPFLGGATPMHGGATPMHGAATPMHDMGAFTPSHSGGVSGDVWRPGVADNEAETSLADSTWGSTTDTSNDTLFNTSTSAVGGWGTNQSPDQGSNTWTPATKETEESQEQDDNVLSVDDSLSAPVWFMDRVCITLQSGENGVIQEINDKIATILLEDKSTTNARASELKLLPPKEHDMVLVTGGADVGVEGELVCIDGSDAILKDANEDFKIVDFCHLAKIEQDS